MAKPPAKPRKLQPDNRNILVVKLSEIAPYANNSRTHSLEQVNQLAASFDKFGYTNPILVDENSMIVAGHGRVMAAQAVYAAGGVLKTPDGRALPKGTILAVSCAGWDEATRRAYIIADNKLALNAGWDDKKLAEELAALDDMDFDLSVIGFTDEELEDLLPEEHGDGTGEPPPPNGNLAEMFGAPPFSVLDTRQGYWQERKKAWAEIIQDKGESRQNTLAAEGNLVAGINDGVSILDGALAEIMCAWFAKAGFDAFDPFAGDSVFGYVAAKQGLNFTGIELRKEQAKLNQDRLKKAKLPGKYICDDSLNMDKHIKDNSMDFIFSCPPYADLEVYSDNPADLSTMSHADFLKVYETILQKTYAKLRDNRFAVITISEVRGKDGQYIGIVPHTINLMVAAGYKFWNEIILVNTLGTLPQRAGKSMQASRKVGRTHQNILVFYKGTAKNIGKEFGDVYLPSEATDEQ